MSEIQFPKNLQKKLFWLDMEMTGLDERADKILEIGVIVTDLSFKEFETYHEVVYQPQEILDNMNDWCKEQHGKSGLTALVPKGKPLAKVEKDLLSLANKFYPKDERVVVCGNSVGQDKKFVDVHMPEFSKRCHYRLVDVTSFKEIFRARYGLEMDKSKGHRALDDIKESIEELKFYLGFIDETKIREAILKGKSK